MRLSKAGNPVRPTRLPPVPRDVACPVRGAGSWIRCPGESCVANSVQRRTYVLDTSVLLADPSSFTRFDEHRVVVPVVVITELEAKRHHPELGCFRRQALRYLDDLRISHGRLDAEVPVGDLGGTIRVELNHIDSQVLPAGFRLGDNDTRILSVARSLANEGHGTADPCPRAGSRPVSESMWLSSTRIVPPRSPTGTSASSKFGNAGGRRGNGVPDRRNSPAEGGDAWLRARGHKPPNRDDDVVFVEPG